MIHRLRKLCLCVILALLVTQFSITGGSELPVVYGEAAGRLALFSMLPTLTSDNSTSHVYVQLQTLKNRLAIAPSNVTVQLSSDNSLVANVAPSIVIPLGDSGGFAEIRSILPGKASISATAEGYEPARPLNILSADPVGFPVKLATYVAPPELPADKESNGFVVIQLLDSRGTPAKAPGAVQVRLASSDTRVATVQPEALIPRGGTMATANVTASFRTGSTKVTASAEGYLSAQTSISVKGTFPARLVLLLSPSDKLPADGRSVTYGVVQLLDASGVPAKAPEKVEVSLSNSRPDVISLNTSRLIIPAGATLASFNLTSGSIVGQALITASTASYPSDTQTITTVQGDVNPGLAPLLASYLIPGVLSPGSESCETCVLVQLRNERGLPLYAPEDTIIGLTSSDTSIVSVTPTILIKKGESSGLAAANATSRPGAVTITMFSEGYKPSRLVIESKGPDASKLSLVASPTILPASGESYSSIVLGLTDAKSSVPVKAPHDIIVQLSSSATETGSVESQVIIPAGSSYVLAEFHTTPAPGKTTITASASGLVSTALQVTTSEPRPNYLKVMTVPDQFLTDGMGYPSIVVQIRDSAGNPGRLDSPVIVQLSSNDLKVGKTDDEVIIEPFQSFAIARFYPTTTLCSKPCSVKIFASASGFKPSSATLRTITLPMEVPLSSHPTSLKVSEESAVVGRVTSEGAPLYNATISWTFKGGDLYDAVARTTASGAVTATFAARSPGNLTVSASVVKPGFQSKSASVIIHASPIQSSWFLLDSITPLYVVPLLIGGVVAVGSFAATYIVGRRRKQSKSADSALDASKKESNQSSKSADSALDASKKESNQS